MPCRAICGSNSTAISSEVENPWLFCIGAPVHDQIRSVLVMEPKAYSATSFQEARPKQGALGEKMAGAIPTLSISTEKVCFVVVKAREFDVKDVATTSDDGSNPTDDRMIEVLEDRPD